MKTNIQKRAALICRVSTGIQETIRQVEELTALAVAKGYMVDPDDVYDDKISGFSKFEDRPALNRLLTNIRTKQKTYHMVFAMEVSRIARKPEEGQKILIEFSDLGVPIYVKNIDMCTHIDGSVDRDGKLKRNQMFGIVFTLLSEFAATEAEYLRERSISGIRSKLKKGYAMGGAFQPYGYTKDEDGKLVIDETERGIVEDIFDYASRGYGITTITNILNDSGVPTRTKKMQPDRILLTKGSGLTKRKIKTSDIKWSDGTVHGILSNQIYKGDRQVKVDEKWEDGSKIPIYNTAKVPAIIEPELFDLVQKVRNDKYNKRSSDLRYMYLLKNLCICGRCGRNMVGRYKPGPNGPTDAYYQCSSKRLGYKTCGNNSVSIEAIESVVWNVLTFSPKVFEYFKSTGTQLHDANNKMDHLKTELKFQEKSQTDLETEKKKVSTLYRKGVYDESEFDEEWAKLIKRGEAIQHHINRVRKQITSVSELRLRLSNIDAYIETVESMRMDRYQIAQLLNNILDKVVVTCTEKNGIGLNYLVSIYIKDLSTPITVYMLTKQRHRNFKEEDFDMSDPEVIASTGQNRFMYVPGGLLEEDVLKYDSTGVIISDIQKTVKYILRRKIKKNELPKTLSKDYNIFSNGNAAIWPALVAFDEENVIDKIKLLNKKQKDNLHAT